MKMGVYLPLNDQAMSVTRLARAVEERGFDSMWVPEHSHIPTTGSTPYPGRGPVTRDFARTLDPFVALTAAAAVTTTLKLGTGVCLVIQRDTIHTAKTIATLDLISNGRVLFGVGGGWNKPEMENHGTTYATRFQKLEEQITALKSIWTEEEASFQGEHVNFGPLWCWPKPVQRPHPPIYLGGETDHTLKRIVRLGNGWLPRVRNPAMVLNGIERLRSFARDAGRDPAEIGISAFGVTPQAEAIAPFLDADVERVIFAINPGNEDEMLRRLDRCAAFTRGNA